MTCRQKYGAYGDFAIAYVIAHEIGHHVQNQMGILEEVHQARAQVSEVRGNQLTVRLELQADFLAGVWAHYADKMLGTIEAAILRKPSVPPQLSAMTCCRKNTRAVLFLMHLPMAQQHSAQAGSAKDGRQAT